jgi:hypothetical protein
MVDPFQGYEEYDFIPFAMGTVLPGKLAPSKSRLRLSNTLGIAKPQAAEAIEL